MKPLINSFVERIERITESGCWLWTGGLNASNYGNFCISKQPRYMLAHRFSYQHFNGPIPEGLHILHKCDVRCCVNPAHLYAGTNADNIRDRIERGKKSGCVGEKAGRAILREVDVINIRAIYKHVKGASQQKLADIYGVSRSCVYHAIHHNWRHI